MRSIKIKSRCRHSLLSLESLQLCQSFCPCSFSCHSSHLTLYSLNILFPFSLLQLGFSFLSFFLQMQKTQSLRYRTKMSDKNLYVLQNSINRRSHSRCKTKCNTITTFQFEEQEKSGHNITQIRTKTHASEFHETSRELK